MENRFARSRSPRDLIKQARTSGNGVLSLRIFPGTDKEDFHGIVEQRREGTINPFKWHTFISIYDSFNPLLVIRPSYDGPVLFREKEITIHFSLSCVACVLDNSFLGKFLWLVTDLSSQVSVKTAIRRLRLFIAAAISIICFFS